MAAAVKNKQVSLNIDETKDFLRHIVENNRYLQAQNKGKIPVAVAIEGESGIGKTSAAIQLADEFNSTNKFNCVKLNLAQIEELGDLVGFPIRQFEVCLEKDCEWIDEQAVPSYTAQGYTFTGKNRMSYCPPEWIAGRTGGGFLILDDWNRADMRFIQAVMELIDRQTYISWKLPKDWHILLTSNPDDGDYLVQSIDEAQRTRFISVNLKFNKDCWARWAEGQELDGRCINFLIKHPELINKKVNARSAVMFFNSISSLPSFENSLPMITMIGEGSVGTEFTSLFTSFIHDKLDRLLSPEEIMFNPNEEWIVTQMKSVIGKTEGKADERYRADIASITATRIINYSLHTATTDAKKITKDTVKRLMNIIKGKIFTPDLSYNMAKLIYTGNNKVFKSFVEDKDLVKHILK